MNIKEITFPQDTVNKSIIIRQTGLIRLDRATKALAEASTLSEVKDIRDKAEAIRKYAAVSGAGLDIQNAGAELKLRAERKAGVMLDDMDRQQVGRPKKLSHDATISEIGITKDQSSRWQHGRAGLRRQVSHEKIIFRFLQFSLLT